MTKLIFTPGDTERYTEEDGYPAAWDANFTWTGRDDYLQWVAAWKACLKQIIADIRAKKAIRRDKTKSIVERNDANGWRQQYRVDCCNLLLIRRLGKQASAKQREQHNLAA
jgi:hypothetical protein